MTAEGGQAQAPHRSAFLGGLSVRDALGQRAYPITLLKIRRVAPPFQGGERLTITRNLALNLYRNAGFNNMAQAERSCKYGLDRILDIFRMK